MVGQLLGTLVTLILLGFALWFLFTLSVVLFFIGAGAALLYWLRNFLIEKEILNPTPGVHITQVDEHVTIIEGNYEHVPEDDKQ